LVVSMQSFVEVILAGEAEHWPGGADANAVSAAAGVNVGAGVKVAPGAHAAGARHGA
jgi:hypothetical protein